MPFIRSKSGIDWYGKIGKHKYFELIFFSSSVDPFRWFDLSTEWTRKHHHAGIRFHLMIGKFDINFSITDVRHWDAKNDCWGPYVETTDKDGWYDDSND